MAPRKQPKNVLHRSFCNLFGLQKSLVSAEMSTEFSRWLVSNPNKQQVQKRVLQASYTSLLQTSTCNLFSGQLLFKQKWSKSWNFEEVYYDTPGVRHSPWKKMFGKIPSFWYVTFQGLRPTSGLYFCQYVCFGTLSKMVSTSKRILNHQWKRVLCEKNLSVVMDTSHLAGDPNQKINTWISMVGSCDFPATWASTKLQVAL